MAVKEMVRNLEMPDASVFKWGVEVDDAMWREMHEK